ncbi:MAG: thiolase family protein [Phycisphaeraceae bacterium]
MVAWATKNGKVAITGGLRTPFVKAGDALKDVHVCDLAALAMRETLYQQSWPASRLDEVVLGNVVMPADATNPARVAALYAGVPKQVPAITVQRNCASGMEAVAYAASRIESAQARALLAGGAESMSTIPLLFPQEALGAMGRLARAKSLMRKVLAAAKLRPRHFRPMPALQMGLTDPTCGLIMGKTAEILASEFDISRRQQDDYALHSHRKASNAMEEGRLDTQVTTAFVPPKYVPVPRDIGPRPDQSHEALAKLKPYFDRRDGTVTVGNACQVTDGAAVLLVMESQLARAEGMNVLGYVRGYATAALDPARMGLGPVYAIDQLLQKTGMRLDQIGLFEINEAFAAQVLACLKALASDDFARSRLGRGSAVGELDPAKLNVNGGAIALGHPVGASGARLVLNLLHEMARRDVEYGIAALCVGGGQGAAMLLQRP